MSDFNILIDELPSTLAIAGEEHAIDTNFRTSMLFEQMIMDSAIPAEKKPLLMLRLFFHDLPSNVDAAADAVLWFYRCGTTEKKKRSGKWRAKRLQKQVYDFDYDAPYIYAAFLDQYGINLNQIEYLHWWEFSALFQGLKHDNKIVEIMGYRATDLSKIKNDEERSRIAELQMIYGLPNKLSKEDKVAAAGAIFGGGLR